MTLPFFHPCKHFANDFHYAFHIPCLFFVPRAPTLISSSSLAQPSLVIHHFSFPWFPQLPSTILHVVIFISPQIALIILLPAKNNLLAVRILKMGNFTYLSTDCSEDTLPIFTDSFSLLY